jgi:hypothetical protein
MIDRVLLEPLRRLFKKPKNVYCFVRRELKLEKVYCFVRRERNLEQRTLYGSEPLPLIYQLELTGVLKKLCNGSPLLKLEERRLKKEVSLSLTYKENPHRFFAVINKKRRSGKSLLACIYALYTLYWLSFQKNTGNLCLELYGATLKQTRFNLMYTIEDLVKATPSLKGKVSIIYNKEKRCCRLSLYTKELYSSKIPIATVIDDANLLSPESKKEIFTQNCNSNFVLIGTLKENNNETSNQELYLESCT